MGYEVVTGELEQAAGAAESAAEQAGQARLEVAAGKIGRGLPGAASAPAARATGGSWRGQVAAWCRDTADYANSLRASAENYRAEERNASDELKSSQRGGA